MQANGIYAIQSSNTVHQFLLNNLINEGFQVIRCTGTVKELAKYKFSPIVSKPTILIIEKLDTRSEVASVLTSLSLKRRTIIFDIKTSKEAYFLKDLKFGGTSVEILPQYKDWAEKEAICSELLIASNVEFKTTKIYERCIKLMIRSFEQLAQIMTDIKLHADIGTVITESILEDIFKDSEIVPLQQWCITMLINEAPVKPVKELHYFLTVKQYAPHWLFEQLKQTIIHIGLVYEAQWSGIVLNENYKDNVKTRATVVNFPYIDTITKFSSTQWREYLRFTSNVDYRDYLKIQRIALQSVVNTDKDLYQLLFNIRASREGECSE